MITFSDAWKAYIQLYRTELYVFSTYSCPCCKKPIKPVFGRHEEPRCKICTENNVSTGVYSKYMKMYRLLNAAAKARSMDFERFLDFIADKRYAKRKHERWLKFQQHHAARKGRMNGMDNMPLSNRYVLYHGNGHEYGGNQ